MKNKQNEQLETPQWIQQWARFILKQSSNATHLDENSLEWVEQVLLATLQGDSCIEQPTALQGALEQHPLLLNAQQAQQQVAPFVYDSRNMYLYRYWQLEQRLATQIQRLIHQKVMPIDLAAFTDLLSDPHQQAALHMVVNHAFNIITGGPGTGKTYTLARIIAVLSQANPDIRIAMAAPTGKAAQRMKEALQASLNDETLNQMGLVSAQLKQQDTQTIHRLLGLGHQPRPRFHLKQPLAYDVIVIDEASMLDLQLATQLLEAVPDGCRLILLGDANQLASVDVGAVLAELQQADSLKSHRVNLVTSRRFKAGAKIGEMAQFIQRCTAERFNANTVLEAFEQQIIQAGTLQNIVLSPEMADVVQLEYLATSLSAQQQADYYTKLSWGFSSYVQALHAYLADDEVSPDPVMTASVNAHVEKVVQAFDQYRILTAIRHGDFGLYRLNQEMQRAVLVQLPMLSVQADWYVGRPVMMTYNDYQLGLSNGDIGICFKHRQLAGQFEVYFASLDKWVPTTRLPKNIETAFALTIHKSQGSEFRHTAVVLDPAALKMLSQELIYTAITRAKSVVSLLVSAEVLAQSFLVKTTRKSGLLSKINDLNLSDG